MAINLPLAAIPARLNPTSNQDAGSGSPIGAVTGALASMLMNSNPLLVERDDPLSKDRTMRCQLLESTSRTLAVFSQLARQTFPLTST